MAFLSEGILRIIPFVAVLATVDQSKLQSSGFDSKMQQHVKYPLILEISNLINKLR